jgi:hypothetical protein
MQMKKVLLVLGALVMVLSSVAMVSAYEAHIINVTTKVENAMRTPVSPIEFGTVFPQEWILKDFKVGTSGSFCAENQTRVTEINYSIFAEWKVLSDNGTPADTSDDTYYPWLGDALYVGVNVLSDADKKPEDAGGKMKLIGDAPATQPGVVGPVISDNLSKSDANPNLNDWITLGLDVPVFEGYYNALTDVAIKPSGLTGPTLIISENDTDRYFPDGVTLGLDLKFQVTDIY